MSNFCSKSGLVIILICFSGLNLLAQSNHLNKKISLNLAFVTVDDLLIEMSKQANFNFSYNSDVVQGDSLVSLKVRNKSVEKTLDEVFQKKVRYKVVNNHVLLLSNTENTDNQRQMQNASHAGTYTITGFVLDANTGLALPNATVFEVDGQISAMTNSLGFYTLVLPSDRALRGLNYCRYDYLDSIVFVRISASMQIDVPLKPRQTELKKIQTRTTVLEQDLESRNLVSWLVPPEAVATAKNLTLPERTTMQISLLPFIGSDYKLSGTKTNNLSLNLLAGYTGAVNGVELGGMVNIVQNDVNGTQIAGFGNIVGHNTKGLQTAGFFNINNGSVTGAQIAGFQNTLNGEMHGAQVSGFNNVTTQNVDGVQLTGFVNVAFKDVNMAQLSGFVNWGRNIGGLQATGGVNFAMGNVEAAQLAGMLNVSRDVNGVQAAGMLNMAYGDIGMAQLAGFANYCDSVTGVQLAGFVNVARLNVTALQAAGFVNYGTSVTGAQVAGFLNVCLEENKGVQVAGLVNYAQTLNGVQIAFVNLANEVERGVPIGFLSFVKEGYHTLELSTDENFYANVAFKTGVKRFYNIFKAGYGYQHVMAYSYGFGGLFSLNEKHEWGMDLTYSVLHDTRNSEVLIGSKAELNPIYNYQLAKYFTLFVGPTFNYSRTEKNTETNSFHQFTGLPIWESESGNYKNQIWFGFRAGFKF